MREFHLAGVWCIIQGSLIEYTQLKSLQIANGEIAMKRIIISLVVLASLVSSYAYAVTYSYTGNAFRFPVAPYTADMQITGTITTSSPIPSNSSSTDISGIITDWSFSDGVQTLNTTNSYLPLGAYFSTNGQGNITNASLRIYTLPQISDGDTFGFIRLSLSSLDEADEDALCVIVNNDGNCGQLIYDYTTAIPGVWTHDYIPPIPTLTHWTAMLLALMLGLFGIARVRLLQKESEGGVLKTNVT